MRESTVRTRAETTGPRGILTAAGVNRGILSVSLVLAFALLTAIGALLRVPLPFTPVPITLQTFFVLLAGALLGSRRGPLSQAAYLTLGAMGLPVFAAGTAALLGPTGGYLVGFVLASLVVGWLTRGPRGRSFVQTVLAMTLGLAVIYLTGALQLAVLTKVGPREAVSMGILPFLLGDAAKLAAAAGIAVALNRRLAS